jgi:hypothetical protein
LVFSHLWVLFSSYSASLGVWVRRHSLQRLDVASRGHLLFLRLSAEVRDDAVDASGIAELMSAAEGSGGVRFNDISDVAVVLLRVGFVFEGSAPAVVVRYTATASFRWRYIELI